GLGHIGDAVEEFFGKHWFGGEAIETRRVDVDARDLGAGARERAGHHPPHAVRRPGNNGYAAREYLRLCHDALPPAQTMTNRLGPFNRAQLPHARCTGDRADVSSHAENTRRERTMWRARLAAASLALIAPSAALGSARAEDELKIAVGGRGIGETFVTEVGYKAGLFKRYNLVLDIFYTDGGGETQQAVISNSAQVGIASGFLGAIGVFAKGAPVRIIGGSYTGGAQVFWYVPADSPIKTPQDLAGKTVA